MAFLRNHRTYHLTAASLAAVTLFTATACSGGAGAVRLDRNGIPIGPISVRWMQRQRLAQLYYPRSRPFYQLGSGSAEKPGTAPAFAGAVLTSGATGAQIYQWYFRKLKALGWHFITDNGCSSVQLDCPQFGHTGHGIRQVFFLGVDSPQELPFVIGRMPPPACTVFEISYEIFPPGGLRVPRPGLSFSGGHKCWWTGTHWRKRADMYP